MVELLTIALAMKLNMLQARTAAQQEHGMLEEQGRQPSCQSYAHVLQGCCCSATAACKLVAAAAC
jgi:hypothetical protein